ncbi:hypothetical protein, conserved [Trypanosoma brucei brucei TREU927]|uniref:CCZ1/INTU/HSP4 first Longin domain-containing protein n=1 Tax=Trypanosoma brucei brucei (strain 927/4 GUTat10.1) TaxID=185431 RepID=Q383R1_TRYB2|nr:hypothetical protein, conserved [Trypanosoma brucei brucei TREU927]EAN79970.1 hypothetical protein, conserved [Trypanosoma brucei brucei TREU927]
MHLLGDIVASNSLSSNASKDNEPCLITLCIYCPTLSGGKEERAIDNVIFFYPARTHPDQQMNQVGFCIGMTCLMERFIPLSSRAKSPVEEIRLSHSIITLCNPFADLWIAVETTPAYNASVVLPLVHLGFDAFVLRYGMGSVSALVNNPREVASGEDCGVARAALRTHFEKFATLLQTSVLVVDPDANHHTVPKSGDLQPPSQAESRRSSLSSSIISIDAMGSSRSTLHNVQRWKRHLMTLAATGGLLTFPAVMRATPSDVQFMCHSIVLRHLSFLSSSIKRRHTSCWGKECHGIPNHTDSEPAVEGAEERLLWTSCRYAVFIGKTLKVVVSNAPQDMISQLICLFLMDPELPSFTIFVGEVPFYCCVYRAESLLTVVVCDEGLYDTMYTPLLSACKKLTDCVADCLSSGVCAPSRAPGSNDGGDAHRVKGHQNTLSPAAGHSSSNATPCFVDPLSGAGKLPNTKSTFQFTVWCDGVLVGSSLQDYFRSVQFSLSAPMRKFIKCVRAERRGSHDFGEHRAIECAGARTSADTNGVTSDTSITLRGANELWVLLPSYTWLCVTRARNHVGGVVFYNAPPLSSCFKAVETIYENVSVTL